MSMEEELVDPIYLRKKKEAADWYVYTKYSTQDNWMRMELRDCVTVILFSGFT